MYGLPGGIEGDRRMERSKEDGQKSKLISTTNSSKFYNNYNLLALYINYMEILILYLTF